jgi:integrase
VTGPPKGLTGHERPARTGRAGVAAAAMVTEPAGPQPLAAHGRDLHRQRPGACRLRTPTRPRRSRSCADRGLPRGAGGAVETGDGGVPVPVAAAVHQVADRRGRTARRSNGGMQAPKVPKEPVPVLSHVHLRALLAACKGAGFAERRDTAIIWLFLDTGMRLAEMTGLTWRISTWTARSPSSWGRGDGRGRVRSVPDRPGARPLPACPWSPQAREHG